MNSAHIHLLLNHIPVLGTFLALALLLASLPRHNVPRTRSALWLLVVLGIVTVGVFLSGEPAEDAVEGLAGVSEPLIESHEEAALASTIALGTLATFAVSALLWFRRRTLPRWVMLGSLAATMIVAGMMAWTANLGGQIRHTEIRGGDVATPSRPGAEGRNASGEHHETEPEDR